MGRVDRKYRAVFDGRCSTCGETYKSGDWIVRLRTAVFAHLECPWDDR